jgi:radical SAM superfamily enzyme YgiQ (UPF0313 family)
MDTGRRAVDTSPQHLAADVGSRPLGDALRVLLVWPRFPPSFWGFGGMLDLLPRETLHPPLGLITVAAMCPANWTLRLIDCAFETLSDDDLAACDLVMVSGMRVQRDSMFDILAHARRCGKRTIVGGPYASSQPEALRDRADHVVVGEPDEVFGSIAADLMQGTARPLYVISDKPDVSRSPTPRFDLLKLDRYVSMTVQLSRGCPFQCEFCDIITIYGRRPRFKSAEQTLREFDALHALGWRDLVFVVDDNFIGDRRRALGLASAIEQWQAERGQPFALSAETSIDLAQHPALIEAMVRANFWTVFVGIESPSAESLTETRKLQNLRQDPLRSIEIIQRGGLWVSAGFIVGFDSDGADIFERQIAFIERAAIPWAMAGFLVALPTTPLYERMRREGRLVESLDVIDSFKPPNFHTVLPLADLLRGGRAILTSVYDPAAFYERSLRSLAVWRTSPRQRPPAQSAFFLVRSLVRSVVQQGVRSDYRKEYWRFLRRMLRQARGDRMKLWVGLTLLVSGHHFIRYAASVAAELDSAAAAVVPITEQRVA